MGCVGTLSLTAFVGGVLLGAAHTGAAGGLNAAAAHSRVVLPQCDVGLVGWGGVRMHRPAHVRTKCVRAGQI